MRSIWVNEDVDFEQFKEDFKRNVQESPHILSLVAATFNQMVDHEALDRALSIQRKVNGRANLF